MRDSVIYWIVGIGITASLGVLFWLNMPTTAPEAITAPKAITIPKAITVPDAIKVPQSKSEQAVKKKHPTWPDGICDLVGNGQIKIGMTIDQVRESWRIRGQLFGSSPRPWSIHKSITKHGVYEIWKMDEGGHLWVYFTDGVVTTIQE